MATRITWFLLVRERPSIPGRIRGVHHWWDVDGEIHTNGPNAVDYAPSRPSEWPGTYRGGENSER